MHRGFLFGLILFLTIITETVCLSQSRHRFESHLYTMHDGISKKIPGIDGFINPDEKSGTSEIIGCKEITDITAGKDGDIMGVFDYNRPVKIRMMYRIEGHDGRWPRFPDDYRIFFPNMKNKIYGFYTGRLNDDGVLSEPKLLLTLHSGTFFRTKTLIMIIILVMIIVVFAYIDYRIRSLRKTNQILEEKEKIAREVKKQRDQLSIMHKNLTDSIRYAQKIQQALLPSDYYFHRLLSESFILYLPKDIVSGDFYWVNEKDGKVFFSVADCTGHGVPGAFMSMIGFEILDKIINDQGIVHPDEILSILNHGIMNTFSRGEDDLLLKDGMDISFCNLDKKNKIIEFAGAFHTLYLVRENTLLEYKGNHVSVGLGEEEQTEQFTKYVIELQEGDCIYLFSDGYPDQFGGLNGKKFMYRRFRHLLLSIHNLPMKQQQQILYDTLLSWKGDREQVDDILIIGVNPLV